MEITQQHRALLEFLSVCQVWLNKHDAVQNTKLYRGSTKVLMKQLESSLNKIIKEAYIAVYNSDEQMANTIIDAYEENITLLSEMQIEECIFAKKALTAIKNRESFEIEIE